MSDDARQRALEIARECGSKSLEYMARYATTVESKPFNGSHVFTFNGDRDMKWQPMPYGWDSSVGSSAHRVANWIAAHALERQDRCKWRGPAYLADDEREWLCETHDVLVRECWDHPERCPGAKR